MRTTSLLRNRRIGGALFESEPALCVWAKAAVQLVRRRTVISSHCLFLIMLSPGHERAIRRWLFATDMSDCNGYAAERLGFYGVFALLDALFDDKCSLASSLSRWSAEGIEFLTGLHEACG